MKTQDKIILFGILAAVLLVNILNTQILSAQFSNITAFTVAQDSGSSENVISGIVETTESSVNATQEEKIPFEYYPNESMEASYKEIETSNGMILKSGSIRNIDNVSVKITANAFGKKLSAQILPNQTWNFAMLNGMVISSDSSQLNADPEKISYYEMNKWLKIGIKGDCKENTIFVYTDSAPTRISSTVNALWKYDYHDRLLTILLKSCSEHTITVDWTYYSISKNVIYVEDMSRFEDYSNDVSVLNKEISYVKSSILALTTTLSSLETDSKTLLDSINKSITEKNSLAFSIEETEKGIKEINKTNQELEMKISQNTILTPLQALLIATIMLAIILYIALFGIESIGTGKTVKKDEKK